MPKQIKYSEEARKKLKNGVDKLAKFETFDQTMRNYYISQFQAALYQPNPNVNMITAEDLGFSEVTE